MQGLCATPRQSRHWVSTYWLGENVYGFPGLIILTATFLTFCKRLILGWPCLSSANTHVQLARIDLLCTHGRGYPICITPRGNISASRRSSLELQTMSRVSRGSNYQEGHLFTSQVNVRYTIFSLNDKYSILTWVSRHGISTPPVENIDFFYLQPRIPPERKRFCISLEEGTFHCCARCKHPSNLRIWGNTSVLQHLNDKWVGTSYQRSNTHLRIFFSGIRSRNPLKE